MYKKFQPHSPACGGFCEAADDIFQGSGSLQAVADLAGEESDIIFCGYAVQELNRAAYEIIGGSIPEKKRYFDKDKVALLSDIMLTTYLGIGIRRRGRWEEVSAIVKECTLLFQQISPYLSKEESEKVAQDLKLCLSAEHEKGNQGLKL